ncbi:MAG: hypothetical protein ACK5GN_07145, partial [Pseudomonadota bacterium]
CASQWRISSADDCRRAPPLAVNNRPPTKSRLNYPWLLSDGFYPDGFYLRDRAYGIKRQII